MIDLKLTPWTFTFVKEKETKHLQENKKKSRKQTFDYVYHDICWLGITGWASIISIVRKFHFVNHKNRTIFRSLNFHPWFIVIIDHATFAIPKDETWCFSRCYQLTFQSKTRSLFDMKIRSSGNHRVRFRDA